MVVQQVSQATLVERIGMSSQVGCVFVRRCPQTVAFGRAFLVHVVKLVFLLGEHGGFTTQGTQYAQHVFRVKITYKAERPQPVELVLLLLGLFLLVGLEHVVYIQVAVLLAQVAQQQTVRQNEHVRVHVCGLAVLDKLFHLFVLEIDPPAAARGLFPGCFQHVEGGLCRGTRQVSQGFDCLFGGIGTKLPRVDVADIGHEALLHLFRSGCQQTTQQEAAQKLSDFHRMSPCGG